MKTLFVIVVIDLIGFGIIIPLLPFYAEHFRASPDVVALLMAVFSFTQFLAAPLWGRLSDRIGRRPVLMISLAGAALCYVWLAFADGLAGLFAARALAGAMAGNITAAFAYAADVTGPSERTRGMGMVGAAFGLGFIAGPAIGGLLAGPDPASANFRLPALAAAALSLLAFALALVALSESLGPGMRARRAAQPRPPALLSQAMRGRLAHRLALVFLVTFVFAGIEATFAMWSERRFGWGPLQNGYVFAFVGMLGALVQGALVGRLARRFGEARLIVHGTATLALGLFLVPFARELVFLLAALAILVYGFGVTSPSITSLISRETSSSEQGRVLGLARSAATLARVAGPAWSGMLFTVLGKDWPFFGGAAVMMVILLIAARGNRDAAHGP